MFTGLIEEIGTVHSVRRTGHYQVVEIAARKVLEGTAPGDSIAVDGVCQTVTRIEGYTFQVETLAASLEKTTLGMLNRGSPVNLERAVTASTRLGGHIVQGHVDGIATIRRIEKKGPNVYLTVELPERLIRYCIAEGSITIDGISLTIASLSGRSVTTNVIPATWDATTLKGRSPGDTVNIEADVIARYVERLLGAPGAPGAHRGMTEEGLRALGY